MKGESGLRADAIAKSFGKHAVLRAVSLEVAPGEVVGLFGRDGAGKTVLFEALMGLTGTDSGEVRLDGADISRLTVDRRAPRGLSYLGQGTSIFRGMTTAQNILAVLELVEPDRAKQRDKLEALLAQFDIAYIRDTPAPRLSGGERRRCEIARAMAASPSVMLLDEPFAGIDPLSVVSISRAILSLKQAGVGVLITDQNVNAMLAIIDRAYVLDEGRIVFAGAPDAMLADATVHRVYLGEKYE
jgi:lipopolysaccharide export system ATP-binding protein